MAGGNGKPLRAEEMIEALRRNRGVIKHASRDLGVSRTTFYNYMERYATVQQARDEIKADAIEYVEGKLMDLIDDKNPAAIFFYLKTQAGYKESHRVEHDGELKIEIEYVNDPYPAPRLSSGSSED